MAQQTGHFEIVNRTAGAVPAIISPMRPICPIPSSKNLIHCGDFIISTSPSRSRQVDDSRGLV